MKPQFKNLHNILPTQESRIKLSNSTNIPLSTINIWLGPNSMKNSVEQSTEFCYVIGKI